MKESELLEVLSSFNDVYLSGPDGEVEIEPQMSIILSKDGSDYQTRVNGYLVSASGKDKKVKPGKFLNYIKKVAIFTDGEFKLIGIGANWKSYEKYLADTDFEKIDMAGLIETYGDIADGFSLTCPYNGYGESGVIFYKISEELAEFAEKEIKDWAKRSAREQLKDCKNLPPFEELYGEIEREYLDYYSKNEKFAGQHDGNVFMCDRFSDGKTKFTEPDELWHVYNNVEFAANCVRVLAEMKNSTAEKPLCAELDGEEALKFNLRDIKVGFVWHCTVSSELSKTFFFELNEETKKWLLRHGNDYDFDILQDLAFYNGDKLLFSSCTHERFHTDMREVNYGKGIR